MKRKAACPGYRGIIAVGFISAWYLLFPGFCPAGCESAAQADELTLTFSLELNRRVYRYSDYGEPPQIAIWLEQPGKGVVRTLFVTQRTAKGKWQGRVDCPVSLPYWESRYMKEIRSRSVPGPAFPAPDAITGATPQKDFTVSCRVPAGSEWYYFIEVNCSGDFNRAFPAMLDKGFPDPYGNGQPSLVYEGRIKAEPGQSAVPQIIGRTDQLEPAAAVVTDLTGITSARDLFSKITVTVSRQLPHA